MFPLFYLCLRCCSILLGFTSAPWTQKFIFSKNFWECDCSIENPRLMSSSTSRPPTCCSLLRSLCLAKITIHSRVFGELINSLLFAYFIRLLRVMRRSCILMTTWKDFSKWERIFLLNFSSHFTFFWFPAIP